MLKIKLTRIGRRNQPQYRIVVSEARSSRETKFKDILGYYNPLGEEYTFNLDHGKYQAWLAKGAQPTSTIRHLAAKSAKPTKSNK